MKPTANPPMPVNKLVVTVRELLQPLARYRKNPRRAVRSPQTTVDRLKDDYDSLFAGLAADSGFHAFLESLLDFIPDDVAPLEERAREQIDSNRAVLRKTADGAELLRLFDLADSHGPISPAMAFVTPRPDDEAVLQFSAIARFLDADDARGERRWLALRDAVPDLIERLYARHVRRLWILSQLSEGAWPARPPRAFGAVVGQLAPRLATYPGLLDPDAAHMRNAVLHRHVRFSTAEETIEFRDQRGWSLTLTLAELEQRLWRMWVHAVELTRSLCAAAHMDLVLRSGLFRNLPLWRDVLRGDARARATLENTDFDSDFHRVVLRAPEMAVDPWFLESGA